QVRVSGRPANPRGRCALRVARGAPPRAGGYARPRREATVRLSHRRPYIIPVKQVGVSVLKPVFSCTTRLARVDHVRGHHVNELLPGNDLDVECGPVTVGRLTDVGEDPKPK